MNEEHRYCSTTKKEPQEQSSTKRSLHEQDFLAIIHIFFYFPNFTLSLLDCLLSSALSIWGEINIVSISAIALHIRQSSQSKNEAARPALRKRIINQKSSDEPWELAVHHILHHVGGGDKRQYVLRWYSYNPADDRDLAAWANLQASFYSQLTTNEGESCSVTTTWTSTCQ